METIFLTAGAEDRGRRLDQFLADGVEELTRSAAQRLAEEQRVLLDGRPLKKNYKITGGETLEISLPEKEGKPARKMSRKETEAAIAKLSAEMREAARLLEFEHAAYLRDKIAKLRESL